MKLLGKIKKYLSKELNTQVYSINKEKNTFDLINLMLTYVRTCRCRSINIVNVLNF